MINWKITIFVSFLQLKAGVWCGVPRVEVAIGSGLTAININYAGAG